MPSSGSCGASTRGVIFNFGYLGTNKEQSTDPDPSCHKYPIPDDTPLPFGHRKIMPGHGNGPSNHACGPGRGDLVDGAELESEPAVVPRVAQQGDQGQRREPGGAGPEFVDQPGLGYGRARWPAR